MSEASEGGHLFVVHGDLTEVHADHLLIPCDGRLNSNTVWSPLLGTTEPGDQTWVRPAGVSAPNGFESHERPPLKLGAVEGRQVWLVNSGRRRGDVEWLVSGVVAAVRHVTRERKTSPRHGRARELIAMPLFGVGNGGFGDRRGAVIASILDALTLVLSEPGSPDVVLVVYKRADYAATQSIRRRTLDDPRIISLADRVRKHGLVLFIGSGASAGAGFPTWKDLLRQLAEEAKLDASEIEAVLDLPAPDAADVIAANLRDADLGAVISKKFTHSGWALTHGLLASLRVTEAVTTNYDRLYENASARPHRGQLVVLPGSRRKADEPWLLKLHGDVEPASSIVLTRDHYVRFDADSVPLASVVQSQMVTKHMLFVGYSLSDENFIRLARQVRQLFSRTGTKGNDTVGTVLSLFADPGRKRLWHDDLDFMPMLDRPFDKDAIPDAARTLEILLDSLAVASCDEASYVFDGRYVDLLTEHDHELVKAAEKLRRAAATTRPDSTAWAKVVAMLADLGDERFADEVEAGTSRATAAPSVVDRPLRRSRE